MTLIKWKGSVATSCAIHTSTTQRVKIAEATAVQAVLDVDDPNTILRVYYLSSINGVIDNGVYLKRVSYHLCTTVRNLRFAKFDLCRYPCWYTDGSLDRAGWKGRCLAVRNRRWLDLRMSGRMGCQWLLRFHQVDNSFVRERSRSCNIAKEGRKERMCRTCWL